MALTLGEVITAARDRHASFHRTRVPHAVVARYLTGYQRRLLLRAADINAGAYVQQASIVFDVSPENAIGVVGAGTPGGMPATDDDSGIPSYVQEGAGALLELTFDRLVTSFVVTAATSTTLQKAFAGWTVNQFIGALVVITDGPGIGQRREILSNTADTVTVTAPWATQPVVGTSLAEIVQETTIIAPDGVQTEMPALGTNTGYLVRLNAQGVPYVDLLKPLIARYAIGIDLPPMEYPIGGTVRFRERGGADFELRRFGQRWTLGVSGYGGYILGGKLFLIGEQEVWSGIESIDLRYLPIIPAFTRLTDFVFLGDRAYETLVAKAAFVMAARVNGLPDIPKINVAEFAAEATVAETIFLDGLGRMDRTVPQWVQEVL